MDATGTNMGLSRATWRKSRRSNGGEGGCVEVTTNLPDVVAVRDSKDPDGPKLIFTRDEWRGFAQKIERGGFELARL